MSSKTNKYHVALDSQGYLLVGTPRQPARKMERAPVFGNRFASGDRDYTDFSIWWYWAQTDWSGGFKDDTAWADDTKYYYSTNIDTYSEIGAIKLSKTITSVNNFDQNLLCGVSVSAHNNEYVGTEDDGTSDKPIVWKSGASWSDVSDSDLTTDHNFIASLFEHKGNLWVGVGGIATADNIARVEDDETWTDYTSDIATAMGWAQVLSARSFAEVGTTLYVSVDDFSNDKTGIASTSDNGSNWAKVVEYTNGENILSQQEYGGDLYYLLDRGNTLELHFYDVSASADSMVYIWRNSTASVSTYTGDRFMFNKFGKLIITVPANEIWEWNGTTMTRIYAKDSTKDAIGSYAVADLLSYGGAESNLYIHWGNLIYDGENFYNSIRDINDSESNILYPLYTDSNNNVNYVSSGDRTHLYEGTSTYRSGSDKNWIVFNEIDEVSTIDKVANAVRIIFDPFDTAEEIEVYYSTDGGSNFTLLGTASATLDGTSITQKTFYFPDTTSFRKLVFKVLLNGDGSSTPKLCDISLQYIPAPDYRYQWQLSINANDYVNLLDNHVRNKDKGIDIRNTLRASFLSQDIVDFEDVDYNETALNGALSASATTITVDSTDGFPEKGRIKIEQEEIKYTGKTSNTFTGCTRGYRGTTAVTHSDNTEVSTKYRVLITDFAEQNNILNKEKALDYIITLNLIEI